MLDKLRWGMKAECVVVNRIVKGNIYPYGGDIVNSRYQYKIDGILEDRVQFEELPEDHEKILHKYMDMADHLRELDQLYRMMRFNLKSIFKYCNLQFNDYVQSNEDEDEDVDAIQLNALIGNGMCLMMKLRSQIFCGLFLK
jgi:hypothetical protein